MRLATQLASALKGVLYVLDEPTVGLHPRDTARLITVLERLRALGNGVLVVEHDLDVLRAADHLVDVGPVAGRDGGHVVAGATAVVGGRSEERDRSLHLRCGGAAADRAQGDRSGAHASSARRLVAQPEVDRRRRAARACSVGVTGPSGSGKSSLVEGTLLPAVRGGGAPLRTTPRRRRISHRSRVLRRSTR